MKKYFLTGGTGNLGAELLKYLNCWAPRRDEFDIRSKHPWEFIDKNLSEFSNIDSIIHCAAYTNVPRSETNRLIAIEANILGSEHVGYMGRTTGKRVVYISTDYVYEGKNGNYTELDRPKPFNFYGFTKLAGEAFMDENSDLIIRTSFKPNAKWMFEAAFSDVYTSCDYVDVIAKEIVFLIKNNATGVFNVGTKRKTIYELAKIRNPDIKKMSKNDVKDVALPVDISMDISKYLEFKKIVEENNAGKQK